MNGWTKGNTLKCKTIGDRAGAYVWLSNKTARRYEKTASIFEITIIVIMFILGGGGIPSLVATDNLTVIMAVNLTIQGLLMLLGTVKAVYEYLDYQKKIKKHNWASTQYSNLFIDIQKMLQTPESDRPKFSEFYAQIEKKEFSLQRKTPYIPENIIKEYYAKLKSRALKRDILFGHSLEIDICIDAGDNPTISVAPTDSEINSSMKKARSVRHEDYAETLKISNKSKSSPRNISIPFSPKKSNTLKAQDSMSPRDKRKVKKLNDKKRYELERYFIDDL